MAQFRPIVKQKQKNNKNVYTQNKTKQEPKEMKNEIKYCIYL